jgi:hypothetical protein
MDSSRSTARAAAAAASESPPTALCFGRMTQFRCQPGPRRRPAARPPPARPGSGTRGPWHGRGCRGSPRPGAGRTPRSELFPLRPRPRPWPRPAKGSRSARVHARTTPGLLSLSRGAGVATAHAAASESNRMTRTPRPTSTSLYTLLVARVSVRCVLCDLRRTPDAPRGPHPIAVTVRWSESDPDSPGPSPTGSGSFCLNLDRRTRRNAGSFCLNNLSEARARSIRFASQPAEPTQ